MWLFYISLLPLKGFGFFFFSSIKNAVVLRGAPLKVVNQNLV